MNIRKINTKKNSFPRLGLTFDFLSLSKMNSMKINLFMKLVSFVTRTLYCTRVAPVSMFALNPPETMSQGWLIPLVRIECKSQCARFRLLFIQ